MTTPTRPTMPVELLGDEEEIAITKGHRDKAAFLAAVLTKVKYAEGGDFTVDDVKYLYQRDATPADGEDKYAGGWKFWDDSVSADNGEPITLLDMSGWLL